MELPEIKKERVYGSPVLTSFLKEPKAVCLDFRGHGMGDCIMFMPLYNRLKELYPECQFDLICSKGQEYFNTVTREDYDLVYPLTFPEFNNRYYGNTGKSKPEMCCVYELGIPFTEDIEFTWKPGELHCNIEIPENTVGIAFQVTSNPHKSILYENAKRVWNTVKEAGYTPLEVHFDHILRDPRNTKYNFINNTCRDYEATVENCLGVIKQCRGFIGVNTGTFCAAVSILGNVLHMFKRWPFAYYKRFKPVPEVDCRDLVIVDTSKVQKYLEGL